MRITMRWREVEVSRHSYDQTFEVSDDFGVTPESLRELAVDADHDDGKSDGCEVVAYEIIDYSIAA